MNMSGFPDSILCQVHRQAAFMHCCRSMIIKCVSGGSKRISLAASLGLNSVRLFLPFELWRQQHDSFMKNLEEFISLLDFYHMTIMPVLFNDCTVAKQFYKEPVPGPQPEPVEGFLGEPVIILLTKKHRQGSR
mgnify:CR=1 FL=1